VVGMELQDMTLGGFVGMLNVRRGGRVLAFDRVKGGWSPSRQSDMLAKVRKQIPAG